LENTLGTITDGRKVSVLLIPGEMKLKHYNSLKLKLLIPKKFKKTVGKQY
jgi:hypothetical protein